MGKETKRCREMRRVLEEYSASEIPRRQFCEERGIAPTTFDHWRRQLRSKPGMVRVEVSEPVKESVEESQFILMLRNGRDNCKLHTERQVGFSTGTSL